jgi:hypothetical protein
MKKSYRILFLALASLLTCGLQVRGQTLPQFGHVVIVALENNGYSSVVGSSSMPYLNSLIAKYGLATNYNADTHPSIGNYFTWIAGQILTNNDSYSPGDAMSCSDSSSVACANGGLGYETVDNIAHELDLAGKTWKDYPEKTGTYYVRHDPLQYMTNITKSNLTNFTQFKTDLGNHALPNFSWITPNGCDDAHDCGLSTADSWLQTNIDPLVQSTYLQPGGDGLLIISFDEDSSGGSCGLTTGTGCGGHVATVIISPYIVSAGFQSKGSYEHENVLRLMAQGLGLTTFPGAAAQAANMSEFFSASASAPSVSLSPVSLSFGNQTVGTTSAARFSTLTNTGNATLTINSLQISGDFAFAGAGNCSGSVAAGASCSISVNFTPTTTGTRTGTVTIADNASNSPQTIPLTGSGVSSSGLTTVSVSPTSLTFGRVKVGHTSSAQTVTVTNTGSASVSIGGVATSGQFAETNNCGSSLAVGASCAVNVSFAPTSSGTQNGTLTISDNASGSPQTVSLTGRGH